MIVKVTFSLYFPAESLGLREIHETVRKTYILLP